jgi:hypothetical protein
MANSNRDQLGRWSSANVAAHTPSTTANGGAPNIADAPTATRPGAADAASFSGSETPAARGAALSISDGSADDWGGPSQTDALINRPAGGQGGGGMGDGGGVGEVVTPDYEEGFGKLKFDGPDLGREVLSAGMANRDGQNAARAAGRDAAMRAGGYGGNESAGQHTVSAPGGPAYHGSNIPGGGIPRPGDYGGAPGGGPRDWSPGSGGTPGGGAGTINLEQGDDGVWGVGG